VGGGRPGFSQAARLPTPSPATRSAPAAPGYALGHDVPSGWRCTAAPSPGFSCRN